jgi:hypothetical protein
VVQSLVAYAIVALATGWTVWRLFLRGWIRRRASAKAQGGCGPDCACGD